MRIAVYAGSFDPITNGHLDIVQRAARLFNRIIVAVVLNPNKNSLFSREERVEMIREACVNIPALTVDCFDGLLVDYVRQQGATAIVRGLRPVSDFDNEFQMAVMNKKLYSDAETIFMMSQPVHSYLSSSTVKEIAGLGGNITDFVPENVAKRLRERLQKK